MTPEELQEHAREYMAAKAYYRAALETILTAFGSSLDITPTRLVELDTHIEVLSEDLEQCAVELSAITTQAKSEDTLVASILAFIQGHPEGVLSSQIAEESGIDIVRVRSTVATLKGRGQVESTKVGNQPAVHRATGNPATRLQQITHVQVLAALNALPKVFRAADLAKLLGRPSNAISSLLCRLKREGAVVMDPPGYYTKTG